MNKGEKQTMRTRILNKMLAAEVEEYLARGGNSIFLGVGVVEVHGDMPVDVEQILPEAQALALAEEYDGLCLINLPYMFPGGTIVSNATVQMSVLDSMNHLTKVLHSLVAQGFKKIYLVSGHGPARLYIDAVQRDFFQETKIHICHINTMELLFRNMRENKQEFSMDVLTNMCFGAYKMLHQEDYLPVDPNGKGIDPELAKIDPRMDRLTAACQACGSPSAIYYSRPEQHMGTDGPFKSIEERDIACAKGEEGIRHIAKITPIPELSAALDEYYEYLDEVMEKYPRLKGQY